jgi:hypothetical protein
MLKVKKLVGFNNICYLNNDSKLLAIYITISIFFEEGACGLEINSLMT